MPVSVRHRSGRSGVNHSAIYERFESSYDCFESEKGSAVTAKALAQHTYMPESTEELAPVFSFLAAHESRRGDVVEPRYMLVGADEHDQVEVPESVHRVLVQVVEALRAGKAVTVAPQSMTLTTQQAADLLGVSRPTVVRLIDTNELPAERNGSRRRVLLEDVLEYRRLRRQRQYDALAATSVDLADEDDPEAVRAQLREARKEVARRRLEQAGGSAKIG